MAKAERRHRKDNTLRRRVAVDPESFGKCLRRPVSSGDQNE